MYMICGLRPSGDFLDLDKYLSDIFTIIYWYKHCISALSLISQFQLIFKGKNRLIKQLINGRKIILFDVFKLKWNLHINLSMIIDGKTFKVVSFI